jgi:uncharacterized damage-inducible protein DinB
MDAFIANYRWLARYNCWINQRLYDAGEQLSNEERKRDRGAFFGSLHNTLNHLVWGDQLWLARFAAQPEVSFSALGGGLLDLPPGAVAETVLYPQWSELRAQRERLDLAIERWVDEMPSDFPLRTMTYSNTKGVRRDPPAWMALTHFFNHQTHHRGQATTLLMQAGIDPGLTDLIALAPAP